MDEKDLARLKYIGIVVLGNLLLLPAVFALAARRRGWRQTMRRILSFRDPFYGLMAVLGVFMILWLVVYPPIAEAVLLRYYYPAEEIKQQHLHVVQIIGKREVVFSNGERKVYEPRARLLLVGICGGLSVPVLVLVCWALARSGNQMFVYRRQHREV